MVVVSNPISCKEEIKIIHALFEEGLELFHVRKPEYSENEMQKFLSEIVIEFRSKLVLHHHHQLASSYGINRIHFTEKDRKKILEMSNPFLTLEKGTLIIFSTSVHLIEDFNTLTDVFEYAFLSPVFKSISKENYLPKIKYSTELQKRTNHITKLIGLSGIAPENCKKALDFGFDDVGLLGTIWTSNKPIENFKLCQQIVLSH